MSKRRMTYKKEGYKCLESSCKRLAAFPRPQELGVHMRRTHGGGSKAAARRKSSVPTAVPVVVAERTVAITNPALMKLATGSETKYFLIDTDDSTRIMHLDKVILATME